MSRKSQGKKKHSRNHSGGNYFYQRVPAVSNRAVRVSQNQKVLSISMLVSGREETTEKSIDSLAQLRERVSSELILVDTGCSDEMHRKLAEKADKIIKFTWCDDFSAARNVAVEAASGQWFMFLDDDEWFEDTTELEEFFLSGDYRRYESASYVQRNYLDMEGAAWRNIHVTRMTRMRPQTRFFYAIHESLWPLLEPEKYFDAYVHHFGYASPDPEVQMAKRQRNLKLLIPTIEGDPHCMKHYLQAVAEYNAMNDYKAACDMADRGIANCDPSRVENAVHIDGLHAAAVRMRLHQRNMEDVVTVGRDFLEHASLNELAQASIYGDLTFAYGELRNYRECLNCAEQFLKRKDYFDQNPDKLYRQDTLILDVTFDEARCRKVLGWTFAAALAVGTAVDTEKMLAAKPLDLWLNSVRDWYTVTTQPHREKWKQDFSAMMAPLETVVQVKGSHRMDSWDGRGGQYPHLRQFYEILTMPEEEMEAAEAAQAESASGALIQAPNGTGSTAGAVQEQAASNAAPETLNAAGSAKDSVQTGQPIQPSAEAAGHQDAEQEGSVAQEMEFLAAQLKEKVRLMIRQGQYQAAHGVVLQLRGFFPQDPELMELELLSGRRK